MLRALFIGVDRYDTPITRLSCARADATALGALFADTLAGDISTLLDEKATLSGIKQGFAALQDAGPDDTVVLGFSGHGTEHHELVPVDADPSSAEALSSTCLPLTELATILDSVPAKNLLVFLDCCFSGGFGGARVFAPNTTRSVFEDRVSVEQLAQGQGRIVLTASSAGEPAFEAAEFGHGLLTHFLLQGLQGSENLAVDGRVPLLGLYEYTMAAVARAAERIGEKQTPTLYGSVEGSPTLPKLNPGARFATAFPERVRAPASGAWNSLRAYGIQDSIIAAWAERMPGLNPLQLEAINEYGVLDGRSLLVVAPTAAGKTMIGELAAVRAVARHSRAAILLPLRALVNDKYDYMLRTYGESLTVVRATGEQNDQVGQFLSGHFDIQPARRI